MHKAVRVSHKPAWVSRKTARILRRTAPVLLLSAAGCLSGWGASAWGQQAGGFGGVESFGITSSYSPDSSHILIGMADQRRTWTAGVEYTHRVGSGQRIGPDGVHRDRVRWDYEGSLLPFYLESDPTITGTLYTIDGHSFFTAQQPVRVIAVEHGPVGSVPAGQNAFVPLYAFYGRKQTYAAALYPLGVRVSALPGWRVQPSFALNLGFVVSDRDIPVDQADTFNFSFSFGPGVQVFTSARYSLRLEYLYRHVSNGHMAYENPGIDQGVFQLTFSRHR